MEKETIIRPSLLSSTFTSLSKDIDEMIELNIENCHYDVMDGMFVPQISFGQPIFKSLFTTYVGKINFDVHLMTYEPYKQTISFINLGCRDITFHYEVLNDELDKFISLKRQYHDLRLGLAISPKTNIDNVLPILKYFDSILIMSVEPGKGGQKYIEGSENKIRHLDEYRKYNYLNYKIGVDGGINAETGSLCYLSGADYLVCGSYYFKSYDRKNPLFKIHEEITKHEVC